jgi:hypothetical protein
VNTWVKVARYNLMRPANYLVLLLAGGHATIRRATV